MWIIALICCQVCLAWLGNPILIQRFIRFYPLPRHCSNIQGSPIEKIKTQLSKENLPIKVN
jgi:Na+/serine symporter